MGCTTSKPVVESTDDVLRNCRIRRSHIRNAINNRRHFAIAHAAYIRSLKTLGLALGNFVQGELSDAYRSRAPPSMHVLALPPPSLGGLSLLPDSSMVVTTLSPPQSVSGLTMNPKTRSVLAFNLSMSPPLSPIRLQPTDQSSSLSPVSPAPETNPTIDTADLLVHESVDPATSPDKGIDFSPEGDYLLPPVMSPDRGDGFSPPYYSPSRDDPDDALVAYSPSPPSSLLTDSSWFNMDIFNLPLIPEHLQERRRMKQSNSQQEEVKNAVGVQHDVEEMPELEEVEHKGNEAAHDALEEMRAKGAEEEKKVILDQELDPSATVNGGILEETTAKEVEVEKEVNAYDKSDHQVDNQEEDKAPSMTDAKLEMPIPAPDIVWKKEPVAANLTEARMYIDDQFARACHCGHDVSRMLETQIYHPENVNIKDSSRRFNAITSHWSRKAISMEAPSMMEDESHEGDDMQECGMTGSHASTLERLYAWERKLYEEVKAAKLLRIAFDQKYKQLHILEAKGKDQTERDKLKATLKKLDTRLIVAIRAIDAASTQIQEVTNEELYSQLSELLEGLLSMWKTMSDCHRIQEAISLQMQAFEDAVEGNEATEVHRKATVEFELELERWQGDLKSWVLSQKKYIDELHEWIMRCYEIQGQPMDLSKMGRRNTYNICEKAPIFHLLKAWRSSLTGFDSWQRVVNRVKSFAASIRSLQENQSNELKFKKQADKSMKHLDQQTLYLKKLERQHTGGGNKASKLIATNRLLGRLSQSPSETQLQEKRIRLDKYKSNAENERNYHWAAVESRKRVTSNLVKEQLPTLFESIASFAADAQKMYETVKEVAKAADMSDREHDAPRLSWH